MANILQYILNLKENLSGKLQQIGATSNAAIGSFNKLEKQTRDTDKVIKDIGGSVSALKQRLNSVRNERDLISASNVKALRQYNTEIKTLEKNIGRIESMKGGKIKQWGSDAMSAIPGGAFLTNPIVLAGAAIAATTKAELSFDAGMAKVNTTAQLSAEKLSSLKSNLIGLGSKYGAEMSRVPDSFEAILSVIGEVNPSMQIFETALKGAKATSADLDVVAKALASTKSILGENKTTADDVLNTFLAAKRVGAGEFSDFAQYMPGLIASAGNLGVTWKQTSGLFSYMTTKVATAAEATMLMQNVFTAFGKGEIQKGLEKNGIRIFDEKGSMRQVEDIMGDLEKRMRGMSDQKKSNFLEDAGFKDAQAKQGISVMVSDPSKLKQIIGDVQNATGEVDAALKNSQNNMQKLGDMWSKVSAAALKIGGAFTTVLSPALDIVNIALDGVLTVATWVYNAFGWVVQKFKEGNPIMVVLATILGFIASGLALNYLWTQRIVAAQMIKAAWDGIIAATTGGWATAQAWLNTTLLASPLTWIIALIVAIIAVIGVLIYKTTGWGEAWDHVVKGSGLIFQAFVETAKLQFEALIGNLIIGLNNIKKGWYQFKNAVGLGDGASNDAIISQINADTEKRKADIKAGADKTKSLWRQGANEFAAAGKSLKWDNTKTIKGGMEALKNNLGLSHPGAVQNKVVPTPSGNKATPSKSKGKSSDSGRKTNEAIATGGTKNTTIHITIGKQIESLTVNATGGIKESAGRIRDIIIDEMTRAVAMSQSLA